MGEVGYKRLLLRSRETPMTEPTNAITTQREEAIVIGKDFSVQPTGLVCTGNPSFEEWSSAGETLGRVEGAVHWWIGDWIRFGEAKYGEKYTEALERTGFQEVTLRNDVWVAGRFEMSRRRDILSWSHHQTVAHLEPAEQDKWLAKAADEGWSVVELRKAIHPPKKPKIPSVDSVVSKLNKLGEDISKHFGHWTDDSKVKVREAVANLAAALVETKDG